MADQSPPVPPLKAHLSQIENIDKHVDHANRGALVNEIISGHLPSRKACLNRAKKRTCGNGRFWRAPCKGGAFQRVQVPPGIRSSRKQSEQSWR